MDAKVKARRPRDRGSDPLRRGIPHSRRGFVSLAVRCRRTQRACCRTPTSRTFTRSSVRGRSLHPLLVCRSDGRLWSLVSGLRSLDSGLWTKDQRPKTGDQRPETKDHRPTHLTDGRPGTHTARSGAIGMTNTRPARGRALGIPLPSCRVIGNFRRRTS
jgi:hypothetical protein